MNCILRRYGYDTNVRKDKLNLGGGGDIVDRHTEGFEDLTDGELFFMAMQQKMQGGGFDKGVRNMPALGGAGSEGGAGGRTIAIPKHR